MLNAPRESRVVVAGETVVDLRRGPDGAVTPHPGGSPANVAVALGRLGRPVQLLTAIGTDAYGDLARAHLAESHVQVSAAAVARTSTARVRIAADGGADYDLDILVDLPDERPVNMAWLHIGSLAALLPPAADKVLHLARETTGRHSVSYDLNFRRPVAAADRRRVEELVSLSSVVKLSDEDAALYDRQVSAEDLALSWLRLGPEIVVVTRAADGAVALTRSGDRLVVPAADGGPVVDTIGAGDAFMAGLIHAMCEEVELVAALAAASVIARRTCEVPGAHPPWSDAGPPPGV